MQSDDDLKNIAAISEALGRYYKSFGRTYQDQLISYAEENGMYE